MTTPTRILLIDDERAFLDPLAERLASRGFEPTLAETGAQGLERLEAARPACVLLDLNLPDMSGLTVLERIKAVSPATPVVMLTGAAEVASAVEGMRLGAFDYLVKPAETDRLAAVLRQACLHGLAQAKSLRLVETGKLASLGRLAEGVAHEINNPLQIILESAGWALDLMEDEAALEAASLAEIRASLLSVADQVRRCKTIVSKLMRFGGRIDPRVAEFSLETLLREVLAATLEDKASAGVRPVLDVPQDLPWPRLPRQELAEVFRQLFLNAVEAMRPHGGLLRVSARAGEDWIEVRVADQGKGVDPEILPHLFEPFFSTKDSAMGPGLGLAACHGVMASIGGSIAVESVPGKGATFTLRFPTAPRNALRDTPSGQTG